MGVGVKYLVAVDHLGSFLAKTPWRRQPIAGAAGMILLNRLARDAASQNNARGDQAARVFRSLRYLMIIGRSERKITTRMTLSIFLWILGTKWPRKKPPRIIESTQP